MRGFSLWLMLCGLIIASGIIVPYGILSGGAPSFDIAVFWLLFGLAVVGMIAAGVARWRL